MPGAIKMYTDHTKFLLIGLNKNMLYLHVITSYNVQSQHYLLNSLWRTEHSFMAFIQNQVNGLIKTFKGSLKKRTKIKRSNHLLNLSPLHSRVS